METYRPVQKPATLNGVVVVSYGDNNIVNNFDGSGAVLPLLNKR